MYIISTQTGWHFVIDEYVVQRGACACAYACIALFEEILPNPSFSSENSQHSECSA